MSLGQAGPRFGTLLTNSRSAIRAMVRRAHATTGRFVATHVSSRYAVRPSRVGQLWAMARSWAERRLDVRTTSGAAMVALAGALVAGAVQPAPAATSSSPTPAAARAEAAEINLVGPDLPGWRQSPNVTSSADAAMADRLASCVGTRPPTSDDVVDVNSPYFDQGNAEVTSNVVVVRSHSDGIQDLAAMKSGKLLPCIRKVSVPYLKSQVGAGVTLSAVTINEVHLNWLPSSSFGYRVSIVLSAKASSGATANEDLSSDSYGFLVGQAEVELDATETSAPGSAKPSSALEQRLVHLLDRRASKFAG